MSLLKALTDPRYWDEVATQARNFGQATSNAVAQVATAPVDLINMGLGFAGAPVSKTPVGGTEWLKQLGLYADVPQGAAQIAGETLGNVLPVAIPAKAPQIANGLLQALANAQAPAQLGKQRGAIVWHGSPHKFDRFDASKIGTGEGNQAYGHGLYLAESPEVAKVYQEVLGKQNLFINGKPYISGASNTEDVAVKSIFSQGYERSVSEAQRLLNEDVDKLWVKDYIAKLKKHKTSKIEEQSTGSLYKVDLPDEHIAKMLDWDKPLSQQSPFVQQAIAKTKGMLPQNAIDDLGGDLSLLYNPKIGADKFLGTMHSLGSNLGETTLQRLGVPGVRYLDGSSRGAGQGASNYVVFPGNEGLLSILSRNGVPIDSTVKAPNMKQRGVVMFGSPEGGASSAFGGRVSMSEQERELAQKAMPVMLSKFANGNFAGGYLPPWNPGQAQAKAFNLYGDNLEELVAAASERYSRAEKAATAAQKRKDSASMTGRLTEEFGDFTKSASTQSKSKYLTHSETGTKLRFSDHPLPIRYDQPDLNFSLNATPDEVIEALRAHLGQ